LAKGGVEIDRQQAQWVGVLSDSGLNDLRHSCSDLCLQQQGLLALLFLLAARAQKRFLEEIMMEVIIGVITYNILYIYIYI
jgi:hypothetical protein